MDDISKFQDQKITNKPPEAYHDEEEETLSLCDFPLNSDKMSNSSASNKIQDMKRRSSSEPSDFFEFFNDISFEMTHAEDIIFCGKLVPYYNKNQPQILKSLSADDATHLSRKCCESLPELKPTTRSINDSHRRRRHRRSSRPFVNPDAADIRRSLSKSSAKSEGSSAKISKPSKWPFVLMFGPLKLQPEMDLQDIKNRQIRRNFPGSILFPAAGNKTDQSRRRSSWGHDLLKVLSCKNHASVAVTASIGLVPHF